MTPSISCDAELQPIGQGCFYTGQIQFYGKLAMSLVYDCGSSTDQNCVRTAINQFHPRLYDKSLDTLVLSHLDADHVNGLDTLLGSTKHVNQVFLPYLPPIERLLNALRFPSEEDSYYELLADPVAFLNDGGANRIFFVSASGDDEDREPEDEPPPEEPPPFNDNNRPEIAVTGDPDPETQNAYESEGNAARNVQCITDRRSLLFNRIWKFRFFQKEGWRRIIDAIIRKGDLAKGSADDEATEKCKKFLTAIKSVLGSLSHQEVIAVIRNRGKLTSLKSAYKEIDKAHNEVSLVLWHGPLRHSKWEFRSTARGFPAAFWDLITWRHFWRYCRGFPSDHAGAMLTADIDLSLLTTRQKFITHYARELPDVGFLHLPHHGSRHNWTVDPRMLAARPVCLVSAGLRNRHGHPDVDVIENLKDTHLLEVLWSHERDPIEMRTTN